LMGSALSIDAKSNDGGGASPHGKAVTGSIEAGVPFALSDRVVFEPQAQLVWQRFWIDDLTDSASKVTFDQNDSYRARIGARLRSNITLGNTLWQPYLKANVLRDFGHQNETTFSNITTLNTKVGQTSGQIAAGIVGRINPISSIYAGLSYQANLDSNEQRILMGNVGVQLNW
ncbi:MAG TPA: autotransporter outer membrane beta-barrel domain-containing protein, partial [Methylophilaceae bacterium]|nr:autotransporter outer membrane beta-barrel domain-containing protein [Methylophilaceae bacterium]